MGSRGPAAKANAQRRLRKGSSTSGSGQVVILPIEELIEPPAPPAGFLRKTKDAWIAFWSSPLASLVSPEMDGMALLRLFTLYDERERAYRIYRSERVVEGSTGQQVINPAGKQMLRLDAEIRQLEDRFGLTPNSRVRLGIRLQHVQRAIEEANEAGQRDDDGGEAGPDPRLAALHESDQDQRRAAAAESGS